MDDRNGECFEHHEAIYNDGPLNTSDSEHECLKEFLLEPRDSIRNVPCSTDSVLNSCMEVHLAPQNDLRGGGVFENCAQPVNSLSEPGVPTNCTELINSQNSCSSAAETTNSEDERNGSYLSPSLNNEDFSHLADSLKHDKRDSENSQFKEETETENSSDLSSVVQKDIDDDEKSTKYNDNKLEDDKSPNESQESLKSETESQDEDLGNGHSSESLSAPKGKSSVRGRKRKTEAAGRGRPNAPTKKKKQPVTYQSQISPDQNGIKLRIKKSSASTTTVQRPNRRRERAKKRKTKKELNTDDDVSDNEADKRVKWKDQDVSEESEAEEPGEQSDWGLRLPITALHHIFLMVTHEEGCLPFLVRSVFYSTIHIFIIRLNGITHR